MAILSKLTLQVLQLSKSSFLTFKPNKAFVFSQRYSHGHLFPKRQGQMYINRFKDVLHFYFIGIGILPLAVIIFGVHVIYGPCRLTDYPKENDAPPRYWQFERTPFRQWYAKYFGVSDMEYHERNLSMFERFNILNYWKRIESRVKHLQGERWDYKGYYYQPISATWAEYARKAHERMFWQWEEHGHTSF